MSLAAVGGVLVTGGILLFTVVRFFCDTLDKRFDQVDKRFDELKAEMREGRAEFREALRQSEARQEKRFDELKADIAALREAVLSVKA